MGWHRSLAVLGGTTRLKRFRLSARISGRLIEHYVAGIPARTASELVDVNRNAAIAFYQRLRKIFVEKMSSVEMFAGEVEVDESYFGGYRRGVRGRGLLVKPQYLALLSAIGWCMLENSRH